MRHLEQTRTLPPSGLLGEAEGSHDVGEVQRNPGGSARSTMRRKLSGGISEWSRNSPGRDRFEPYTASAGEKPESSLGEDRRPNITRGR